MPISHSRKINLSSNFVIAVILSVTFLSFANTLSFDFTNFDEGKYVVLNQHIRDLSPSGIFAIFSSMDLNLYTPLTTLSFAVDYTLWGLNPAGYHAVNLLLHLLNTCMVFLFCKRLSRSIIAAGIAACFFGVHPIHVESIAWVAERKDLLFTAYAMSSLLLYDVYRSHPERRMALTASIFMFLCSLLAKPQAVALPVIMFLMDYFYDDEFDFRQSLNRIWPYAVIAVIVCGLTLYFSILTREAGIYIYCPTSVYAWWNRPFPVTYGICFYILKLIWPFDFLAWYACPNETKGMLPFIYYLSTFGIVGLFWATCRLWKQKKHLVFGVFFFILILLPVLQIVPFGPVIVAERYAYMSSVGIFLITGQAIAGHIKAQPAFRNQWLMAVIFVVLGLALLTYERNKVWADSETLYTDIIAKNPRVALAYNNRGLARYHQGDYAGAGRDYDEAIRLDPKHVSSFNNRGILRGKTGDTNRAFSDYDAAIAVNPNCADAYHNRGLLFEAKGDAVGALRDFTDAIRSNPESDAAYVARGTLRNKQGQYDKALVDFVCAIRLNPKNPIAFNNRGVARYHQGNYAGAVLDYNEAIRLDSKYVNAFFNRGILRGQTGNVSGAISDYDATIVLDPRYAEAYHNRGLLLDMTGDANGALRDFSNAILSNPGLDTAFAARGTIRAERGEYDKALADFKNALMLNPTNAIVYFNMGKVYLALTNSAAARMCFENARHLGLQPDALLSGK